MPNEEDTGVAAPDISTDGAEAAFTALVQRQARFAFRVAYAMLRSPEDAEDVVQETFMKLYRNGAWQQIRDERGFLARATWRVALDHLAARKSSAVRPAAAHTAAGRSAIFDTDNLPSTVSTPEEAAIEADQHATIHRLIDALPEELRQPLALTSIEALTSREIAAVLGVSEGTVRTRLMRARQMLRQKLAALKEIRHGL